MGRARFFAGRQRKTLMFVIGAESLALRAAGEKGVSWRFHGSLGPSCEGGAKSPPRASMASPVRAWAEWKPKA
jgi:hypothetical protein